MKRRFVAGNDRFRITPLNPRRRRLRLLANVEDLTFFFSLKRLGIEKTVAKSRAFEYIGVTKGACLRLSGRRSLSNETQLQNDSESSGRPTVNREAKSDVFADLFGTPKYALQFYQSQHPEDKIATVEDVEIVTLKNVLVDKMYNDVGFRIGDRLIILVEHQSTWSENIVVRIFLYIAQSVKDYVDEHKLNLYSGKRVKLPKPEAYVVYTGDKESCPEILSLNELFWDGEENYTVDVRVKVIRDGKKGDIINQYIVFTRVLAEQIKIHGKTLKAVEETIRICKERNVLKEYLESRESEVMTIMDSLFDQEVIFERYLNEERQTAREEGREEGREEANAEFRKREAELKEEVEKAAKKAAERTSREIAIEYAKDLLTDLGLSLDAVAKYSRLPLSDVEELAKSLGK